MIRRKEIKIIKQKSDSRETFRNLDTIKDKYTIIALTTSHENIFYNCTRHLLR